MTHVSEALYKNAQEATLDLSFEAGWLSAAIKTAIRYLEDGKIDLALAVLRPAIDKENFAQVLQRHKEWRQSPIGTA